MSQTARRQYRGPGRLPQDLAEFSARLRTRVSPLMARLETESRRLSPAWAWVKSRLEIVSTTGWICLAVLAGALALGLSLGWRELWAAACGITMLFIAAVAFVLGRAGYEVTIDLASTRVVVGEQAVGRVVVRNAGSRAIAPADVELPIGRALATFEVPRLAGQEELEELFTIPTHRRAVLQLGPARSVKSDPLRLLRRVQPLNEPGVLYVHPRTAPLGNASTGLLRDLEGLARQNLSNDDISFHALREYAPGDDRRHIHWKSSARAQQLMVRQFEETRRSQLAILLASRHSEYFEDEEFELAVSVAGSVGVQALSEGKAITLLGPHRPVARHTRAQLLDGLSGVELDEHARPLEEQAGTIASRAPGASIIVLVAGSRISPEQLSRASARLPLTAQRLAVTIDRASVLRRRTNGDLTVLTVPALDGLGAAFRKGLG